MLDFDCRFVPTMNCLLYHSSDGKAGREKLRRQHMPLGVPKESFPVIITSFEVAMNDRRFLAKYKWKYIIVDEVSGLLTEVGLINWIFLLLLVIINLTLPFVILT